MIIKIRVSKATSEDAAYARMNDRVNSIEANVRKLENIIDVDYKDTLVLNVGGEKIRLILNDDKTVTWNFADELSNLSYVDVDTIIVGNPVTVYGKAIGGTAPYTYSYYFKKSTDTSWVTKQANTTATSVSITLGSAVVYNLKTAEKIININVTAAEGDEPFDEPGIEEVKINGK